MRSPASLPLRSLVLAGAALVAASAPSLSADLLEYRRSAVLRGEIWRLLSSHLVHASRSHLLWDLLALLVLGFLFEEVLERRYWLVVAISSTVIGAGLIVFEPDLDSYCGLSGILSALWISGALFSLRRDKTRGDRFAAGLWWLCLALGLLKVVWDTSGGAPLFVSAQPLGGRPVPAAHALGALVGAMVFLLDGGGVSDTPERDAGTRRAARVIRR